MSNPIFNSKIKYIKQITDINNKSINNINKSHKNSKEDYTKELKDLSFLANNQKRIRIKNIKNDSPLNKSNIFLPKIQNIQKKVNNSENNIKKILIESNSLSDINKMGRSIDIQLSEVLKTLKKDKTQITLFENNKCGTLSQNKKILNQINNVTNINNIKIHSNNSNKTEDNIVIDIKKNNNIFSKFLNKKNNGIKSISENNNTSNNVMVINKRNKLNTIFSYNEKKKSYNNKIYGNIKIIPANSFNNLSYDKNKKDILIYNNRNIIKELNLSSKKNLSDSLPDININKEIINKNIYHAKINEKNNEDKNNNIDKTKTFITDLNGFNTKFILFLKLIETHIDISILISNKKQYKGNFRKKSYNLLNSEIIFKLTSLINIFFNILTVVYKQSDNILTNKSLKDSIDNFFIFSALNDIFHKIIKIQICIYSSLFIVLSQLSLNEINNNIKNYFQKILKVINDAFIDFFEYFIKDELIQKYPELIKNNLKSDFLECVKKINHNKEKLNCKNSDILLNISKKSNKAFESIKNYIIIISKYSEIKPFGETVFQMISSFNKKNLYQFTLIFLQTILFGELEINKKKIIQNAKNFNTNFKNLNQKNNRGNNINYLGSSFRNNVKEIPPFLPPINSKYKYTLILDMDETLVHYFFTSLNGMFLVRPYCFEFLSELNNLYEIITFTAGTKEYADPILNQLDINDNIIKYRLYRQHMTIIGINAYKDLNQLGRDLKKIIIIDNMKENYKMNHNNGIFIKSWTTDVYDCQLKDLLKILKDIVLYNIDDVRLIIKKMNEIIQNDDNLINPYSKLNIKEIIETIEKLKK